MQDIINMIIPAGINFGWGICGKYLTLEMSRLAHVVFITENFTLENIGNVNHYSTLKKLAPSQRMLNTLMRDGFFHFEKPVIQAIQSNNLLPSFMKAKSPRNIGYTFFEYNILRKNIEMARDYYDVIVAGSSWCEKILNGNGLTNTRTIIQGVDPDLFNSNRTGKELYKDKFVIFSGGKLELRKGQDLVIRAFKALQDKYDDILLVNSWYNHWKQSMDTMSFSPYIRFEMPGVDYFRAINHLLTKNGMDPEKVITLPPKPYSEMPDIYRNTDLGLFPNRCEGGTNLVLMEYMACGKPVIASLSSGHKDILTEKNSLQVKTLKEFNIKGSDGNMIAEWDDPDLDEVISKLEWAYLNRDQLQHIGKKASETMSALTWQESARQFYGLACGENR